MDFTAVSNPVPCASSVSLSISQTTNIYWAPALSALGSKLEMQGESTEVQPRLGRGTSCFWPAHWLNPFGTDVSWCYAPRTLGPSALGMSPGLFPSPILLHWPCYQPASAPTRQNLFPNIDGWEMSRVCLMKLVHGLPPRSGCKESGLEIAWPLSLLTTPIPIFSI